MRIIRAADCKVMPWKNGSGTTTEIVVFPEGASLSDFDWRISMAHVGSDGPFSSFAGVDRTLSVLNGAGIELVFGDGETVSLDTAAAPFPFAADRPVSGRLPGGPIDDLNVMTRRGAWQHKVRRLAGAGPHHLDAEGALLVLVAHSGRWALRVGATDTVHLGAGDSMIASAPDDLTVEGAGTGAGTGAIFAIRLSATA